MNPADGVELSNVNSILINFIESATNRNESFASNKLIRSHYFESHQSPIMIGRTKECKIRFKEGGLSRI
jgi:hypothetical protein